jgi:hypothetical protein
VYCESSSLCQPKLTHFTCCNQVAAGYYRNSISRNWLKFDFYMALLYDEFLRNHARTCTYQIWRWSLFRIRQRRLNDWKKLYRIGICFRTKYYDTAHAVQHATDNQHYNNLNITPLLRKVSRINQTLSAVIWILQSSSFQTSIANDYTSVRGHHIHTT